MENEDENWDFNDMRCLLTVIFVLGLLPSLDAAGKPEREPFDDAIDRGLEYLAGNQAADGSWSSRQGPDTAVTSLCVMSFMSAGHVPGEGKYGGGVDKGIKYVLDQQQRNGLFAGSFQGQMEMYQHGISTLMIAEAIGMLPDRREAKILREKLELAVGVILKAQVSGGGDGGGWRYSVRSVDADISVTGWQLMALRAAKNVGCDVPAEHIEQAGAYIKRCWDPSTGGYRYQRHQPVTVPCTGTSVLALSLIEKGYFKSTEAYKAGSYLLRNQLDPRRPHFFYGIYYTSQAMFQIGERRKDENNNDNNYWLSYRKHLHELLLRQNPPMAAGCWKGYGWDDLNVGTRYCTAMAILALTVEYRFLPIYQRGEEPAPEG
jgi:hypothetical protein